LSAFLLIDINLGFLTEGKLAAILIIPSSWGSQLAGHSPRTRNLLVPSTTRQQLFFWPPSNASALFLAPLLGNKEE
jgi:hypothetical protein